MNHHTDLRRHRPLFRFVPLARLSVVVAIVVLGGWALPPAEVSATTAGETVTPFNQGGEWWATDGCSYVPDRGSTFDFQHACVHHDGCYQFAWGSRWSCDWWFRTDMRSSCRAMHPSWTWRRTSCYSVADLYWSGVRALGWPAYQNRTRLARIG